MPLTRGAQQQREADTVRSRPNRAGFRCPDLATLDEHLARLTEQRKAPTLTDAGRRRFAEDIDALLDARHGLVAMQRGLDVS
ncbi:hypothetical protein ABT341_00305 [Pseudonocardia alni]|uniref:hypothetical protein n=1 Tax=Pseudonocardia alni TaxID=33907 RepID=UPI00333066C5